MGYLDNSTIVVDAVLTKQGRKLLAQGSGLAIKYFTLSDTGVDYTLWNPDHPSGSAYYGEAIENLPNLEALPNSAYFMRNNLISLPRNTKSMPYVMLDNVGLGQTASYTWGLNATNPLTFPVVLENWTGEGGTGWQCIVPDGSLITVAPGAWTAASISGNAQQYLNDQEIANAVVYDSNNASSITIERNDTTTERSLTLTFISKVTGAYKHFNLTLPKFPNP